MSRIGAIVRRLYAEEMKSATNQGVKTTEGRRKKSKLKAFKKSLSSRRAILWFIRIAAVLLVIAVIAESIFQFNRLVSWHTVVRARQADVERELKRRENLIPNLVYAVSKYAAYEQNVFKHVSDAREALKMIRNPQTPKTQITNVLETTLSRLVALAEEYPDLKATQSIQDLIKEAANTEDRIAEAKKEYNSASEIYNQYRTIVPGNVYALLYGFKEHPFMGMDEAVQVPIINLTMTELGVDAVEDVKTSVSDPTVTKQGENMEEKPPTSLEVSDQRDNNTIKR